MQARSPDNLLFMLAETRFYFTGVTLKPCPIL
nr:MAG TPA: hypothetical protein [Caudoviricetes sp.]